MKIMCSRLLRSAHVTVYSAALRAGATAKLVGIQAAYDNYCADVLKTGKQTLSIKDWNEQLRMAGA